MTVSTVNGGDVGLVGPALEIALFRINALHPGIVGDTLFWSDKPPEVLEGYRSRMPSGRLASMAISWARSTSCWRAAAQGDNLYVDGGWMVT